MTNKTYNFVNVSPSKRVLYVTSFPAKNLKSLHSHRLVLGVTRKLTTTLLMIAVFLVGYVPFTASAMNTKLNPSTINIVLNKEDGMSKTDLRNWASYHRVSKGKGIQNNENQIIVTDKWRVDNRIPLNEFKEYNDIGSGKNRHRPGYEALMRDVEGGLIKMIVTRSVSRIMRNASQFAQFLEICDKHQVKVLFLQEGLTNDGIMGKAMIGIAAIFAQVEREIMIENTLDGIERARRAGKKLGRPKNSPDGYKRSRAGYYIGWNKRKQSSHLGNLPIKPNFTQDLGKDFDLKA